MVNEISERKISLELPFSDANKNHVRTIYAMSISMLMEVAGTSLIRATYGFDNFMVIIKKMNVNYLKPANENVFCNLEIDVETAKKLIEPIEERKRGNFPLNISVKNKDDEEIANGEFVFYLFKI